MPGRAEWSHSLTQAEQSKNPSTHTRGHKRDDGFSLKGELLHPAEWYAVFNASF